MDSTSWFAVRGTTLMRVVEELRASYLSARRDDIPRQFRLFERPAPTRAQWWTMVRLEPTEGGLPAQASTRWAQVLSYRFVRPAIALEREERRWTHTLFDAGRVLSPRDERAGPLLGVEPSALGAAADHRELLRALGLELPEQHAGSVVYAPSEADLALASADWKGLPSLRS